MTIRLANLKAYKLTPATRGASSWTARATAIREIAPDVLALQEVVVDESCPPSQWAVEASAIVQQLAAEDASDHLPVVCTIDPSKISGER